MPEAILVGLGAYLLTDVIYGLANTARVEIKKHKNPCESHIQDLEYRIKEWEKFKPIGLCSYVFKGAIKELFSDLKDIELDSINSQPLKV